MGLWVLKKLESHQPGGWWNQQITPHRVCSGSPIESRPNNYAHFEYIGSISNVKSYPNSGPNFTTQLDDTWKDFAEFDPDSAELIFQRSDSRYVRALYKDVLASTLKGDVPKLLPTDFLWSLAKELSLYYLEGMRSRPKLDFDNWEFSGNTSGGFYWTRIKKCKTKLEIIEKFPSELMNRAFPPPSVGLSETTVPLDSTADKVEMLTDEEIERRKVRTIFPTEFDHLLREKYLYHEQNCFIKSDDGWMKYGFVKQYGGFHELFRDLEEFTLIWEGDASGWDRSVCLEPVYEIRNALLDISSDYDRDLCSFVTSFACRPIMVLPNGDIVRRQTGNNSGRNNTTTDNCIAHFLIKIYFCLNVLKTCNCDLTLTNVFYYFLIYLFSDDYIGGCRHHELGISKDKFFKLELEIYSRFGITIKPSSIVVTERSSPGIIPECHSFLGSFAEYSPKLSQYIPVPRYGKICSSFVYKHLNVLDIEQQFSRLLSLSVLLYPNEKLFDASLKFVSYFIKLYPGYFWRFKEIMNEFEVDVGVRNTFVKLYTGYESGDFRQGGFKFSTLSSFLPSSPCSFIEIRKEGGFNFNKMNTLNNPIVETIKPQWQQGHSSQ